MSKFLPRLLAALAFLLTVLVGCERNEPEELSDLPRQRALRAEASARINSWIAGTYAFAWNDSSYPLFDGLNVTNQFFRKLGCCKLVDGVPLTQANIDDPANWDSAFNDNKCGDWIDDERAQQK